MGFPRQEYWSGLPCPPPGGLPHPGIKPRSPALQTSSLPTEPLGKPSFHEYTQLLNSSSGPPCVHLSACQLTCPPLPPSFLLLISSLLLHSLSPEVLIHPFLPLLTHYLPREASHRQRMTSLPATSWLYTVAPLWRRLAFILLPFPL